MEPRKIFPARQRGQRCRRMPTKAEGFALRSISVCDIATSVIHNDSWHSLDSPGQLLTSSSAAGSLLNEKNAHHAGWSKVCDSPAAFFLDSFQILGRVVARPESLYLRNPGRFVPLPQLTARWTHSFFSCAKHSPHSNPEPCTGCACERRFATEALQGPLPKAFNAEG